MKIAISSDSTLAITQSEAKELGIHVIPLNVIVDGHEYHDDIDITREQLVEFMRANKRISTSTPPFEIEIFCASLPWVRQVVILQFRKLSRCLISRMCKFYGDKVIVINSNSLCHFMAITSSRPKNGAMKGLVP